MGYRSDARLLFYCDEGDMNYAALKLWVQENMADELENMEEFKHGQSKGFVFEWESVKWYEGYPDIDKIEDAIDRFAELFDAKREEGMPDFSYEFVRIGENDDDTEVRQSSNCDYLLHVSRSIQWN